MPISQSSSKHLVMNNVYLKIRLYLLSFTLFSPIAAKSLESCPTLCDPIDGSLPGFPSLGFSRQEHWSGLPFPSPMHECILSCFSRVQLRATPRTAAHQAPLSTEFPRQEYWNGLPFPFPHIWMSDPYSDYCVSCISRG